MGSPTEWIKRFFGLVQVSKALREIAGEHVFRNSELKAKDRNRHRQMRWITDKNFWTNLGEAHLKVWQRDFESSMRLDPPGDITKRSHVLAVFQ